MRDDEIDRALSAEEEIAPSSGFSRAVMEAVTSEAAAPPPIPFPWRRMVPAIVVGALAVTAFLWTARSAPAPSPELVPMLESIAHAASAVELPWLLGVAALTLACTLLGPRLVGRNRA